MGVERSNVPPEESFERDAIEQCQRQRRARIWLAFASFVVGQLGSGYADALGNIGLTETRTEPGGSKPVWDGPSCSVIRQEKSRFAERQASAPSLLAQTIVRPLQPVIRAQSCKVFLRMPLQGRRSMCCVDANEECCLVDADTKKTPYRSPAGMPAFARPIRCDVLGVADREICAHKK